MQPTTTFVTDPVCGMTIHPDKAVVLEYEGGTFHFCERACADTFRADQKRWLEPLSHASHQHGEAHR